MKNLPGSYILPNSRPFPGERVTWNADNAGGKGTVMRQIRSTTGGMVIEIQDDITGGLFPLEPYEYEMTDESEAHANYAHRTREHIEKVRYHLARFRGELERRMRNHDFSKFREPEFSLFAKALPGLASSTYDSEEYHANLKKIQPALDHHYAHNSHHPEHYEDGIKGMNLVDVVEMFCDWMAAVERHRDGDIQSSIERNEARFNIPPALSEIFRNTITIIQ